MVASLERTQSAYHLLLSSPSKLRVLSRAFFIVRRVSSFSRILFRPYLFRILFKFNIKDRRRNDYCMYDKTSFSVLCQYRSNKIPEIPSSGKYIALCWNIGIEETRNMEFRFCVSWFWDLSNTKFLQYFGGLPSLNPNDKNRNPTDLSVVEPLGCRIVSAVRRRRKSADPININIGSKSSNLNLNTIVRILD